MNLNGADLDGSDLRGANLDKANLSGASLYDSLLDRAFLRQANLQRAFLARAGLSSANFRGADLSGADLDLAFLDGADLTGANLTGTQLARASLIGTDFTGANLTDTDFTNSRMKETWFGRVNLCQCKGLETVEHLGPSNIGIDALYRSGGNIPEVFLRGAGVPEPFIANMKALVGAMSPVEFYSVFISYSHADKEFARKLHDSLQARGIRCWLDEHQLLPGDDIYHEVDRGIRLWDKMLLCCSESSLKSWWVDNEIGTAFDKEQQLMKDRGAKVHVLVPLNLDGYLFSDKWKSGYQAQVKRRLAADFTESIAGPNFDEQVERLIKALRADEGAREKPPKPRL